MSAAHANPGTPRRPPAGLSSDAARSDRSGLVFVVDDDASVRAALDRLLRSVGLSVRGFGSAAELLAHVSLESPSCLVLDVRLPGESGLDLQRELADRELAIPIVFITGHGDIPMSVKAIKAGAVEFLTKPFRDEELIAAIEQALERDRSTRRAAAELGAARTRLGSLSPREREVLEGVVAGRLNKQIAFELGISEVTVKIHRRRVMTKMAASSVADLVRVCERLGIAATRRSDHTKV